MRNSKKKINKLNFVSISHKKIERAKKMNLYLKVQENKGGINSSQMASTYLDKCEKNDSLVKEELNSQISFINAKREQKSFKTN